ncbi:hypothetical protein MMC25_006187 [Agyrium rufum]|nr:hypothetical protein [Agyrium rufum]
MLFSALTTLALAASGVLARAVPATHVVHEKRDLELGGSYSRLIKGERISGDVKLPMRIGLKQSNLEKGQDFLLDISHPDSPKYGQHWTQEEVIAMFAPSKDTVQAVTDWIVEAAGIVKERIHHSGNKAWLAFDATTEEAERLVHAEYHQYEHQSSGKKFAACDQYHVPKKIQEHIDYITPGVKGTRMHFGGGPPDASLEKRAMNSRPTKYRPMPDLEKAITTGDLKTCDIAITPACIQALYGITPQKPKAKVNPKNGMGIFEEGDFYAQEDLDLFFSNFTSYIPNGTHPTPAFIDGATAPVNVSKAGGESDLDFELAYPIVFPQTITLYQTDDKFYSNGPSNATGIFNTFLDALDGSYCTYSAFGETGNDPVLDPIYPDPNGYMGPLQCGVYKPTPVISISYGEQEQDLPAYYQERQCNEFMKLGLQGTSIFVASGDTGVGGIPGDGSANGCLGPNATIFSPTQPNSCGFVTNVGATKVYPGRTVFQPESAVVDLPGAPYRSAFSSGGGFSNIFGVPSYQAKAVASFFARHNPTYPYYSGGKNIGKNGGIYNRLGRGIPDVAANGDNIAVYNRGRFGLSGGTSASSPIFASIVNRINEERLAAGKKVVGFINPVLYNHPNVLNDITNGTNPGCGTEGFKSVQGWDPVTGLGTPNYPKMLALFMSLP